MGGPYYDLYALCPERTEAHAQRFLAEWAPNRVAAADEYCIPQFSDRPIHVFAEAEDVIRFLVVNTSETQAVYWQSGRNDDVEHVMLFFTSDGGMVAGLSIADTRAPEEVSPVFFRLARSVGAHYGYLTSEQAPEYESQDAFRAECARREIALIAGAKVEPT